MGRKGGHGREREILMRARHGAVSGKRRKERDEPAVCGDTTKNRGYLHLNLATDNSVAKFSNGFATDYTYIIFLILATDFSNG